jgi:hypothetical protein
MRMPSLEEARAAVTTFGQRVEQNVGQLQGAGQGVVAAQRGYQDRLGHTSQENYRKVENTSQVARQRIADAIQELNGASAAARSFATVVA